MRARDVVFLRITVRQKIRAKTIPSRPRKKTNAKNPTTKGVTKKSRSYNPVVVRTGDVPGRSPDAAAHSFDDTLHALPVGSRPKFGCRNTAVSWSDLGCLYLRCTLEATHHSQPTAPVCHLRVHWAIKLDRSFASRIQERLKRKPSYCHFVMLQPRTPAPAPRPPLTGEPACGRKSDRRACPAPTQRSPRRRSWPQSSAKTAD